MWFSSWARFGVYKLGPVQGCLVLVGEDIELDAVGRQFEPCPYRRLRLHRWRPCGVTWDAVPSEKTTPWASQDNPGYPGIGF